MTDNDVKILDVRIAGRLIDDIWSFWFGLQDVHSLEYRYPLDLWFGGSWAVDVYLRQRFGWVHRLFLDALLSEQEQRREPPASSQSRMSTAELIAPWQQAALSIDPSQPARGHMALVLLLDQYARNMYRGTAHMFTTDVLALPIALEVLDTPALLSTLSRPERLILSVCLTHAEDMEMARRCVAIRRQLLDEVPDTHPEPRRVFELGVKQGCDHQEIIERFGRYPHRNHLLSRQTSPEEDAFLRESEHLDFVRSVSHVEQVPPAVQERIDAYLRAYEAEPHPFVPIELLCAWRDELA